jgi:agmatine/peptidylarginine deiminase
MAGMLPEWAEQWGVMLTWPHDDSDWALLLDDIEAVYLQIAEAVLEYENLLIVARDADHQEHIMNRLATLPQASEAHGRIIFALAPSNDTWARDHGPIAVDSFEGLELRDFQFNGWGGKWAAEQDNLINACLDGQGIWAAPLVAINRVLEGGGLETDGEGTLLTTRQCLLSPGRNPDLDEAGTETLLRDALEVDRILWLGHGHLEGDDTDSHIDTLARFADPETIVYQGCDDPSDPHYEDLQAMARELAALRRRDGEAYRLFALPWPGAQHDPDSGQRLPASYANFLIINGAVLLPLYNDPVDEAALDVIGEAFPDHDLIGIDCRTVIRGFGSLHCLTMQLPLGSIAD